MPLNPKQEDNIDSVHHFWDPHPSKFLFKGQVKPGHKNLSEIKLNEQGTI